MRSSLYGFVVDPPQHRLASNQYKPLKKDEKNQTQQSLGNELKQNESN